ncbi:MAG: heparinase II/III family protein [Alphaproteobacteria bacterium]
MLAMLKLWHVGEGRLAAFNGAGLEAPEGVLTILAADMANSAAITSARDTGFERLDAGQTSVIVDCGGEAPIAFAEFAHTGAAAFEFVSGGLPIVVNCGRSQSSGGQARVFRTAAAHSTLSFVGAPARAATPDVLASRLAPAEIEARREDAAGGAFLEISRVIADHGRRHVRRLYLDAAGQDLRGEDKIEPASGADASAAQYRLRFHLHPAIVAEPRDGHVELRTSEGEAWQFRCRGGELALTESIFNGAKGALATKQIVIRGEAGGEAVAVSWAFRRISAQAPG